MNAPWSPCRVSLDPRDDSIFCLVSAEDFGWAAQWCWQFTWDRHKRKRYATRSTWLNGHRIKIYMHKAILVERMGLVAPSPHHIIGDHGDGNSLNNQRWNLNWATRSQNRKNIWL